uniref:Uncharacterized protein n=1 Tax=Knipowitschia caucasica TaxID=637954 RepID=A0AAV2KJ97_KNICA
MLLLVVGEGGKERAPHCKYGGGQTLGEEDRAQRRFDSRRESDLRTGEAFGGKSLTPTRNYEKECDSPVSAPPLAIMEDPL